ELGLLLRRQQPGLIDDPARQGGEADVARPLGRGASGQRQPAERQGGEQQGRQPTHLSGAEARHWAGGAEPGVVGAAFPPGWAGFSASKLTVGAVCAPSVAWNSCIGSEPPWRVLAQITVGKVRSEVL